MDAQRRFHEDLVAEEEIEASIQQELTALRELWEARGQ